MIFGNAAIKGKRIPRLIGSALTYNSGSTVSADIPAETQDGDFLLALGSGANSETLLSASGWTIHRTDLASSGTGGTFVASKTALSEPSTRSFTWSGGTSSIIAIMAYRAVYLVDDAGDVNNTGAAPSVTSTVRPGVLVGSFFREATQATAPSPPSGMVLVDYLTNSGLSLGIYQDIGFGTGASGTKNVSWSVGGELAHFLVQIR